MSDFEVYGNIFDYDADAIVCPSCIEPIIGVGLDRQIYEFAGKEQLLDARKKIGRLKVSQAKHTAGFHLKYKYIIHVATPFWKDDSTQIKEVLVQCYLNVLKKAIQLDCKSIVFPLLGAGIQGFPFFEALDIAKDAITLFFNKNPKNKNLYQNTKLVLRHEDENNQKIINALNNYMIFAAYDLKDEQNELYQEYLFSLDYELTSQKKMIQQLKKEEKERRERELQEEKERELRNVSYFIQKYADNYEAYMNLDLRKLLIGFIEEREVSDAAIAKTAGIEKSTLSRILSGKTTSPSRDTVIALGFALRLKENEFRLLLKARDIHDAFPSDKRDCLILYHIKTEKWNLVMLNHVLDKEQLCLIGEKEEKRYSEKTNSR